jgi:hypothetical protein
LPRSSLSPRLESSEGGSLHWGRSGLREHAFDLFVQDSAVRESVPQKTMGWSFDISQVFAISQSSRNRLPGIHPPIPREYGFFMIPDSNRLKRIWLLSSQFS